MEPTDLNNALQQIGMLSEAAAVMDDRAVRKGPRVVVASKPARSQITASPHTTTTRRRKGKHRKPKLTPHPPQQPSKNSNTESTSDEDGSDDEYFYPPTIPKQKDNVETEESSCDDEEEYGDDRDSQLEDYELQLALKLSAMDAGASDESEEQCKFKANIFPRQHVLVQLDDDKGTQRPHTEGHVWEIITAKDYHPRGIKVRLMSGDIGRVQSIFDSTTTNSTHSTTNNKLNNNTKSTNNSKTNTTRQLETESVDCPVGCGKKVEVTKMDSHVDECLSQRYISDNLSIH